MENVINAKERNYAFVIFIISFTITVAIMVGAVYFDTLIPHKDNEVLRKKIEETNYQIDQQKKFIAAMNDVKILIDSLNKLGIVHPLVEREISEQMGIMNNEQYHGGIYGTINKEIFLFIYEYTEMNKQILNLNKDLKEVEQLKNELSRTKIELEEVNRSLDTYRNSSNLGLGRQ